MNTKSHVAFISCEPSDEKQFEICLRGQGLKFNTGLGCFEGVKEKAYLISLGTEPRLVASRLDFVVALGASFNQDSVLYCDNERTAYLMSCTGPAAPMIGKLEPVALPSGDYSYFNGCYYEVK